MHVHFMGIGGCGVSGLALMVMAEGYEVTGCDISEGPYLKMVREKGIECCVGHSENHLSGVDILVKSTAISNDHPEVVYAKEKGIEVYNRGSFLAKILADREVIGIAGSHGKTTTCWMTYYLLKKSGMNPSVYAGGKSNGRTNINAGNPVIVELDESDGTVFEMNPDILTINNLEFEHVDHFKSESNMRIVFERYLMKRENRRLIIGRGFEPGDSLASLFNALSVPSLDEIKEKKSYENVSNHRFIFKDGCWVMIFGGKEFFAGTVTDAPYIIQNRFSAMLTASLYLNNLGVELSFTDEDFWKSIPVIDRRFQKTGIYKNVVLIDDYAHHPTEIAAAIEQAEITYKNFAILFQPHRSTRFNAFYSKYKKALTVAAPIIILPVYLAGEKETGATSYDLYMELKESGNSDIYYFSSVDEAGLYLKENINNLRVSALVSLGAGDLNKVFSYLKTEQN